MKNLMLSVFALLISSQAFANSNCISEVSTAFKKAEPMHVLKSVTFKGHVKPNEDLFLGQGEVWNSTNKTLEVYYVESGFMASYGFGVLVEPKTCKVVKMTEVYFE